jgi:glycosyltransferase 2 family protein
VAGLERSLAGHNRFKATLDRSLLAQSFRRVISVVRNLETSWRQHAGGIEKLAMFAAKLLVTGACFWYVSRQIDLEQVLSAVPLLDFRWAAFAISIAMLEIPLVGMRWRSVLDALAWRNARMTTVAIIAVTGIGAFFAQVLPSVASEGVRAWLLVRLGSDWRNAVTSIVIDRGVGAALLIAAGFVILLLPSGLIALGEYRPVVLVVYGALLLAGALGLLFAPMLVAPLSQWRYSRWFATLATEARGVVIGPNGPMILGIGCLVHGLTILVIWSLGRAQGLLLPVPDAAVLLIVMVGVALVPISISGWGLRELAVVSLLGHHGVAPERALLFSVCFGLTLAISSLPGAVAWLAYSFAPARHFARHGG